MSGAGQGILDAGSACGCPELSTRDTIWVDDANGDELGPRPGRATTSTCLTERFVNADDMLTIEPGTVVLGAQGVYPPSKCQPTMKSASCGLFVQHLPRCPLGGSRRQVDGPGQRHVSHPVFVPGRPHGWQRRARCSRSVGWGGPL